MFPRKFHVCDAFGIPVYLDFSFLVLLVIFMMDFRPFAYGLSFALVLALSVTFHELGHALAARSFGYMTRDITLSLLGGCASLISLPRKAHQELITAIAGPAVSFLLSALAWGALMWLPIDNYYLREMLEYAKWMNLILGVFNLLPGFPLDGGRIFRSLMRIFTTRVKATYVAMVVGRVFAVLLALTGLYSIWNSGGWRFVTLLIAWMIWREGYREYQLAVMEESWGYSARVSPPPYGGDDDEVSISRN